MAVLLWLLSVSVQGIQSRGDIMKAAQVLERYAASERNFAFAHLVAINLAAANLVEANLSTANLARVNLFEANLVKANLVKANLAQATLRKANLAEAQLTVPPLESNKNRS